MALPAAIAWRRSQADEGRSVAFTNGLFDLLHLGHVRYLQAARRLADRLIVGINSDASAGRLKPGRPLVPEAERAEVLAALACVDAVVLFEEVDATSLVQALRPDVYAKGGDWAPEAGRQAPEAAVVSGYGGRVVYLPYLAGHSTTALIERIRSMSASQP